MKSGLKKKPGLRWQGRVTPRSLVSEPLHLLWVLFLGIDKHFSLKPRVVVLNFAEVERTSQRRKILGTDLLQTPQEDTLFCLRPTELTLLTAGASEHPDVEGGGLWALEYPEIRVSCHVAG